jgi:hypothetical protein
MSADESLIQIILKRPAKPPKTDFNRCFRTRRNLPEIGVPPGSPDMRIVHHQLSEGTTAVLSIPEYSRQVSVIRHIFRLDRVHRTSVQKGLHGRKIE